MSTGAIKHELIETNFRLSARKMLLDAINDLSDFDEPEEQCHSRSNLFENTSQRTYNCIIYLGDHWAVDFCYRKRNYATFVFGWDCGILFTK